MKKIISSILVIAIVMCFCSCDSDLENNNYKKIEYQNDEIFDKIIVFTIPDSWVYAETFDENTNNLIVFRDERGQQIGNVALNSLYSGEDDIFSVKEKVVPIENAKYTKISENCFITTDKGRGSIITYKVKDVVIDIFFNMFVKKDIVKQIAKNISVKDFEIKEENEETVSSTSSSSTPSTNIIISQKPNIDFIEEPSLVNNAIDVISSK